MINLIKADLYRITRSKGIYITFLIFIFLLVLESIGEAGTVGVSIQSANTGIYQPANILYGINMPFVVMGHLDNYLYVLLAAIVIIAASDFSSSTVKNILSNGTSRITYFMSKLTLLSIFSALLVLISFILPTLIVTVLNGFGGTLDSAYMADIVAAFFLELLMYISMTCLGLFFVFSTRKTAYVNTLFILYNFIPVLVILLFSQFIPNLMDLFKYETITTIRNISAIETFESVDYVRTVLIGLGITTFSFIGTYISFRKCDIK